MTDDQDEVSERFLMMRPTSDAAPEQFGPALMAVDENLRKQADEQFKPSGTNPNGMHNFVDPKESWILPSFNQQYVSSVPKNVSVSILFVIYLKKKKQIYELYMLYLNVELFIFYISCGQDRESQT